MRASRSVPPPSGRRPLWRARCQLSCGAAVRPLSAPLSPSLSVSDAARLSSPCSVPTSSVSQPCPNLPRGLGTRKAVRKQWCPQPHSMVPTFCYTFMWENGKGRKHLFPYEKRRTPLGTPRLGPPLVNSLHRNIKSCPNPLGGWAGRSEVGTGTGRASIPDSRGVHHRFRFSTGPPDATFGGDRSRRPTACEPSR